MNEHDEEVETTLKVNIGYVGDMQAALSPLASEQWIEVRGGGLLPEKLDIDEIARHDDGHCVIYVSPRGAA